MPALTPPWHDPFWADPPEDDDAPASEAVIIRRNAVRARYDRQAAHAILDASPMCHLAFMARDHPMVIPTLQVRLDDVIYIHGSSGSRMGLGTRGEATPVTLNVSLVDSLVLARSGLHHSINHRSLIVVGEAVQVTDRGEKVRALDATVDKVAPGRSSEIRPVTDKELQKTAVMRLPLEQFSLKVRADWVSDEPEDMDADVWAGLVPIHTTYGTPEANPDLAPEVRASSVITRLDGLSVEEAIRPRSA